MAILATAKEIEAIKKIAKMLFKEFKTLISILYR